MSMRSVLVQILFVTLFGIPVLQAQRAAPRRHAIVANVTEPVAQQRTETATGAQIAKAAGPAETKNEIVEHLKCALILDYATYLVVVVTAIFTIFLAAFAIIEWRVAAKLRRKLAAQQRDLDKERRGLDKRVIKFKSKIQAQEQRLISSQRFLEAVLTHHSTLLLGIVEGFGAAMKPDEGRRLKSLIFEAEAALDLFHPDKTEVFNALRRLAEVGSDGSVSSLVQLRDDNTADPGIRLRAEQVLTKVKERIRQV